MRTNNKASGKRAADPQWSPDGLDYVFNLRKSATSKDSDIWNGELRHR